jgi:hypothetical protein
MTGHVRYEMTMFRWAMARLGVVRPPLAAGLTFADGLPVPNLEPIELWHPDADLAKEALHIHTRGLVHFFRNPKYTGEDKDDVFARHYIDDWDEVADGGGNLEWIDDNLRIFINKRVAHVTAHRYRVDKSHDEIPLTTVLGHMFAVLGRFHDRLDDDEVRHLIYGPDYNRRLDQAVSDAAIAAPPTPEARTPKAEAERSPGGTAFPRGSIADPRTCR